MGRSEPTQKGEITVIKRISILFNTELRKRMEEDKKFRDCRGMQEAVKLINAIFAMYVHPQHLSDYESFEDKVTKFFDGSHCEHLTMAGLFKKAKRVNVVLNFEKFDSEHITVKFLFVSIFQKRKREEYYEFSFNSITGQCGISGAQY